MLFRKPRDSCDRSAQQRKRRKERHVRFVLRVIRVAVARDLGIRHAVPIGERVDNRLIVSSLTFCREELPSECRAAQDDERGEEIVANAHRQKVAARFRANGTGAFVRGAIHG
jgi:hypothetical protein